MVKGGNVHENGHVLSGDAFVVRFPCRGKNEDDPATDDGEDLRDGDSDKDNG